MTIRHLKIFIEVAETGKMSKAAEHCFISQPTVSQAIRELEEHYQVRLFERLSKKLYITEAGKQLLAYAYKVINQYELLESSMEETFRTERLRIGATITVGACLLSSILNDLKSIHPTLTTYVSVANTSLIEEMLLQSELDVALIEGEVSSSDLIRIPVVDDFLVLAMAKNHPLAQKKQIHIKELENYDLVIREKGSGTRKLFETYLEKHGITCRVAWEAACVDAIKSAILYNGCISAISARLVEHEVVNDMIHVVRNQEDDWNRNFYLVYHKDKLFSEPMCTLQNIMKNYKSPQFLDHRATGYLTAG